jgi:hypothetical protein
MLRWTASSAVFIRLMKYCGFSLRLLIPGAYHCAKYALSYRSVVSKPADILVDLKHARRAHSSGYLNVFGYFAGLSLIVIAHLFSQVYSSPSDALRF